MKGTEELLTFHQFSSRNVTDIDDDEYDENIKEIFRLEFSGKPGIIVECAPKVVATAPLLVEASGNNSTPVLC